MIGDNCSSWAGYDPKVSMGILTPGVWSYMHAIPNNRADWIANPKNPDFVGSHPLSSFAPCPLNTSSYLLEHQPMWNRLFLKQDQKDAIQVLGDGLSFPMFCSTTSSKVVKSGSELQK